MDIPFDSRNTKYKNKFGAQPSDSDIFLRILIRRELGICRAELVIQKDGEEEMSQGMFWAGMAGERFEWWDVTFTPDSEGLYFYYFRIEDNSGRRRFICLDRRGKGIICDSKGNMWQQTVYLPDFETPDGFKGGIIYQIFPDRFYRSENAKIGEIPYGRVIREDWGGQPEYRWTADHKILNNDYFCGNLAGICEKLPYLKSLSVNCIYLNPIFEAHSNHRYDTADYERIDPLLGNEEDLKKLCSEAEKLGIKVILDGVFSHTGSDSKYFNREGRYGNQGAYNSPESPYYGWFKFNRWPDDYTSWWGIETLPEVIEESSDFINYICGDKGILKKWQDKGVSGYRLDVADELPDLFLDNLRRSVKSTNHNALIIGEVWEDASNKSSYGSRRRYLQGRQLDSVMNYPFYNAIVAFMRGGGADVLDECVMQITENYPPQSVNTLMNHLGTHDTERILNLLAAESCEGRDREWQAVHGMDEWQYSRGVQLLRLASAIQYTLPGIPSLYYGDEAGLTGYKDPFNRGCFPWGKENTELTDWYRTLGRIRKDNSVLKDGAYKCLISEGGLYVYERVADCGRLLVAVNRNDYPVERELENCWEKAKAEIGRKPKDGKLIIHAMDAAILSLKK